MREVLKCHAEAPIPDPRALVPELPEDVVSIIATAMAKNPADRYQNASEMLRDLEAVLKALTPDA